MLIIISFSMEGMRQQIPEPYIVQINSFPFKMQQTTVKLCNQLNRESLWSSSIFCEEKLIFLKEEKISIIRTVSDNASIIEV